jgi:flavin-dependent dehydrogenase
MVSDTDVFIAGAGPAGLAAAISAAAAGFSVNVADALRPPINKACGEGLMPDSIAVLSRLGVTLADSESYCFRGIRFVGEKHSADAFFPAGPGRGVRRTRLSELMVARAAALGVRFHWQTTVRGLVENEVVLSNGRIRARWIIGADGHHSTVRQLANLDARNVRSQRIGLRQHFRIAPWSEMVEVYWGTHSQAYVTPVAKDEVCVAIISRRRPGPYARELLEFPQLAERLQSAPESDSVIGSATLDTKVATVARGKVALIGDASGGVDALTGEGLALAFRQAEALTKSMREDDLTSYSRAHAVICRLPHFMSTSMLLLDRNKVLRERTLRAFARRPELFNSMLRIHIGEVMPPLWGREGILSLGARVLLA